MTPICVERFKQELLRACPKERLPCLLMKLNSYNNSLGYTGVCSVIASAVNYAYPEGNLDSKINLIHLLQRVIYCRHGEWGFLDISREQFSPNRSTIRKTRLEMLSYAIQEVIGDTKCC